MPKWASVFRHSALPAFHILEALMRDIWEWREWSESSDPHEFGKYGLLAGMKMTSFPGFDRTGKTPVFCSRFARTPHPIGLNRA
jgi:hypothetical protein